MELFHSICFKDELENFIDTIGTRTLAGNEIPEVILMKRILDALPLHCDFKLLALTFCREEVALLEEKSLNELCICQLNFASVDF